ncbi:MAG: hypothetical protein HY739_11050 [Desulfobacterales bacterium]|nr:hypothetical protein [Desulfobacterales bacterium]
MRKHPYVIIGSIMAILLIGCQATVPKKAEEAPEVKSVFVLAARPGDHR